MGSRFVLSFGVALQTAATALSPFIVGRVSVLVWSPPWFQCINPSVLPSGSMVLSHDARRSDTRTLDESNIRTLGARLDTSGVDARAHAS